jgi:YHS domain-containing protein
VRPWRILFWSLALAGWLVAAVLITLRWHPQPAAVAAPAPSAALRTLCPVCHAVVDPATAAHANYRGTTYYFCQSQENGRSHKELFLAWPEHYLSGQPMLPVADRSPAPSAAAPGPALTPTPGAAALPGPVATLTALMARISLHPSLQATATAVPPTPVASARASKAASSLSIPQSLPTMPPARQELDPQ